MIFEITAEQRKGIPKYREKEFEILTKQWLESILAFAHSEFVAKVPFDTGRTRDAIFKTEVRRVGSFYRGRVGVGEVEELRPGEDPEYPLFTHRGTGIYGPFGNVIRPRTQSVMRFYWRKKATWMVRATVKGQEAQPYLQDIERDVRNKIKVEKRALLGIMKQSINLRII